MKRVKEIEITFYDGTKSKVSTFTDISYRVEEDIRVGTRVKFEFEAYLRDLSDNPGQHQSSTYWPR